MSAKMRRQHLIRELLSSHEVGSQAQLVQLLAEHSVEVAQATVCRDLVELGVAKMRTAGRTVYAIPATDAPEALRSGTLRRVFSDWVLEVRSSLNLVVLRTPPGSAHVVASAIDRSGNGIEGVVGTVAGDDTLLVVACEELGGRAVAERCRELAGL
ncbi:arginine repressor [Candidatus Poriferisodalis sp.]|uniref:arginine repressor n=1 Tax=Candidatus Poriferisodalis sp. TaxID=3101277 RepID=UPI003B0231BC